MPGVADRAFCLDPKKQLVRSGRLRASSRLSGQLNILAVTIEPSDVNPHLPQDRGRRVLGSPKVPTRHSIRVVSSDYQKRPGGCLVAIRSHSHHTRNEQSKHCHGANSPEPHVPASSVSAAVGSRGKSGKIHSRQPEKATRAVQKSEKGRKLRVRKEDGNDCL